jgi:hypothetical protein
LRYLKRALLGVFAVAVVVAAVLFACHGDRSISTSVLIHGSPAAVWHVLVTTSEYPQWNPMIDRISGDLREGSVIEVDEGMVFHPTILVFRADSELRWRGHVGIPGLFDGEHRFVLEAHGDDTQLIQSELFTGILAGRITRGVIDQTVDAMREMNLALKTRVESGAAGVTERLQ